MNKVLNGTLMLMDDSRQGNAEQARTVENSRLVKSVLYSYWSKKLETCLLIFICAHASQRALLFKIQVQFTLKMFFLIHKGNRDTSETALLVSVILTSVAILQDFYCDERTNATCFIATVAN